MGGTIRGRSNIIPGTLVLGIFAYVGDRSYQYFQARSQHQRPRPASESHPGESRWDSLMASKWSPMKSISDEEYRDRLSEQLLRVDAEIAVLDEDIAALRAAEKNSSPPVVDSSKGSNRDI